MAISQLENYLKNQNNKQFSSQTFSDFRQELLQHANLYYKDNIVDFSEVSLGGMLLDFAAIVGDSLVYYAEQQFNELDYTTATDVNNIVKHMQRANIKSSKASPASVEITFTRRTTYFKKRNNNSFRYRDSFYFAGRHRLFFWVY